MRHPVYEITLPAGFGYVSVLRWHPTYGDILGVDVTPSDEPLIDTDAFKFGRIVIFPLRAAMAAKRLPARYAGDLQPQQAPNITFKFAVRDQSGGAIYWWLWDGAAITLADARQDLSSVPERRVLTQKDFMNIWS